MGGGVGGTVLSTLLLQHREDCSSSWWLLGGTRVGELEMTCICGTDETDDVEEEGLSVISDAMEF